MSWTEADLRGVPTPRSAAAAIGALCVPRPVSSCARGAGFAAHVEASPAKLCEAIRAIVVRGGGNEPPRLACGNACFGADLRALCARRGRAAAAPPCSFSQTSFRRRAHVLCVAARNACAPLSDAVRSATSAGVFC